MGLAGLVLAGALFGLSTPKAYSGDSMNVYRGLADAVMAEGLEKGDTSKVVLGIRANAMFNALDTPQTGPDVVYTTRESKPVKNEIRESKPVKNEIRESKPVDPVIYQKTLEKDKEIYNELIEGYVGHCSNEQWGAALILNKATLKSLGKIQEDLRAYGRVSSTSKRLDLEDEDRRLSRIKAKLNIEQEELLSRVAPRE
jgi:hypothetical protein